MRALGFCLCLSLVLCLVGCIMPDQVTDVQKDLAEVRRQLNEVQESQTETARRISDLEEKTGEGEGVTRADVADLKIGLDQIHRQVAVSEERMNDIDRRLGKLNEETRQIRIMARQGTLVQVARPPAGAEDSAGASREDAPPGDSADAPVPLAGEGTMPDPEALYNTAYADFSRGNYALAISGFEEFQQKYPDSSEADNALYWVAECHFSQGNFPASVSALDRLLDEYSDSEKVPAANLKKALAYLEQNQIGQAIVQLRYVESTYSGSDEAKLAREKLTSLGADI